MEEEHNHYVKIQNLFEAILELKQDAFDENDFFYRLSEKLGGVLNLEYCAIGRRIEEELVDYPPYTRYRNKDFYAHKTVETCSISNSLVGEALLKMEDRLSGTNNKILFLTKTTGDDINNKKVSVNQHHASIYVSEILHSKQQKEIIVVGLFKKNGLSFKNIGYIHIINKVDKGYSVSNPLLGKFSETDENIILSMASLIQTLLISYDKENVLNQQKEDEKLNNELIHNNNIDDSYEKFFNHINIAFNCQVSAFWYPIWDGFENISKESNQEEKGSLKMILRKSYISPSKQNIELARKQQSFAENELYLSEDVKKYINSQDTSIKRISVHNIPSQTLWNEIELGITDVIIIPIFRAKDEMFFSYKSDKYEHIIGLIYLGFDSKHKFRFEDEKRLKLLAKNFGITIENKIFKRRFEQITTLKKELSRLSVNDPKSFYSNVAAIIKEMMLCEVCTIFLVDNVKRELILKASTANHVNIREGKDFANSSVKTKSTYELIGKTIYDFNNYHHKESLTIKAINNRQSYLSFDEDNFRRKTFKIFSEEVDGGSYIHQSVLSAPIFNDDEDVIGIVKCVNKKHERVLFQSFVQADQVFLTLITSIVSKFIEYFRFNQDRTTSATMFIHELALPMQAIMTSRYIINRRLNTKPLDIVKINENLERQETDLEQLELLTSIFRTGYGVNEKQKSTKAVIFPKKDVIRIVESLRREAQVNRKIGIYLELNDMKEMFVDLGQFKQVVYNLLKNAIRYSNDYERDIEIYYKEELVDRKNTGNFQLYDTLSFHNWGIGIEVDEQNKVFNMGFRGKKAIEKQPGSGIGLFVVDNIMRTHRGFVEIKRLHKPTVIKIYFPKL